MAWIRCNKKGSGSATLITKSITQNGTYNASSDGADGYSQATVNVAPNFLVLDPADLIPNTYIKTDGTPASYNGWSATDYIPVVEGETLNVKSCYRTNYNCWYDSSKNPINNFNLTVGISTLTVPANAVYFRASESNSNLSYLTIWRD